MDQESDRARMHRLATACQPLKRQRSRGNSARIHIDGLEFARERSDHPARPAVERMRQPVPGLGRTGEGIPLQAAGESQKNDGSERREYAVELVRIREKGAAHREPGIGRTPTKLIEERHGQASYVRLRGDGGAAPCLT